MANRWLRQPTSLSWREQDRSMNTRPKDDPKPARWGIYHRDREYAREAGDPCLGVVRAATKAEAEVEARRRGFAGPTGLWADRLPGGSR